MKYVRINGQPAGRSGARTTCEAKVVDEPAKGGDVSPDVRIGGPLGVVREIRSGKAPVALAIGIVMAFMGRGSMKGKGCMLGGIAMATGISMLAQAAYRAVQNTIAHAHQAAPHPVHAATGAKYLAGEEDLDFSLPGHFPVEWQRMYSSLDTRADGLFGAGWSVPFGVALEATPGGAG